MEDIHADGRISQEEMKRLNQFMVQRLGEVFYLLLQKNSDDLTNLLAFSSETAHGWDNLDLSELDERIQLERGLSNDSFRINKSPSLLPAKWGEEREVANGE